MTELCLDSAPTDSSYESVRCRDLKNRARCRLLKASECSAAIGVRLMSSMNQERWEREKIGNSRRIATSTIDFAQRHYAITALP